MFDTEVKIETHFSTSKKTKVPLRIIVRRIEKMFMTVSTSAVFL